MRESADGVMVAHRLIASAGPLDARRIRPPGPTTAPPSDYRLRCRWRVVPRLSTGGGSGIWLAPTPVMAGDACAVATGGRRAPVASRVSREEEQGAAGPRAGAQQLPLLTGEQVDARAGDERQGYCRRPLCSVASQRVWRGPGRPFENRVARCGGARSVDVRQRCGIGRLVAHGGSEQRADHLAHREEARRLPQQGVGRSLISAQPISLGAEPGS